jgi:cobalt-zinc-cadmium efflux system outer membrane protein
MQLKLRAKRFFTLTPPYIFYGATILLGYTQTCLAKVAIAAEPDKISNLKIENLTNCNSNSSLIYLAAGPIAKPAAVAQPNIKPNIAPLDQSTSNANPAATGTGDNSSAALNSGSVEYDEKIPDTSSAPAMDIVDSLNEALMNSPRAAAIRALFGVTQAGYAAVTQVPNPVFFFDRGMVAEQENRIGPLLTVEPPWKLFFRFLIQKRVVDQSRFDLMTQLWQLRADVRRAYTEVVVAQETFRTLDELYALSFRLETAVRKRFQAGAVPELDAMKARLATSQTAADRIVGAQRVIKARQSLNIILGRNVENLINIPELPDFTLKNAPKRPLVDNGLLPNFNKEVDSLSSYLAIAENNRLEMKSIYQQLKVISANLKSAYGNIIPNPSLAFGKSEQGNVPTGPKVTAVFFTLNAETPFTNTNQGNIATYKATEKQLRLQLQSERNQISSDVTAAYQNLLANREKLRTYQEHILSDSNEVARLARRSYEAGQSDITATLQAQQDNVAVRSAYLDAVTNYQAAFVNLEQACGIPLE